MISFFNCKYIRYSVYNEKYRTNQVDTNDVFVKLIWSVRATQAPDTHTLS